MRKSITNSCGKTHEHEWMLRDPFNFDGPIFECRCGQKRVELDGTFRTLPAPEPGRRPFTRGSTV